MEGAWLLGHVSGLGAPGSLGWEVLSLAGPDSVDSAGRRRGAACSPEELQLEGQGGRPGEAESGVGGSPRSLASEPGFQELLGRRAGGGSVPSVWSWWVRLVFAGGRASGETACVYVRKRRPRFGAITAACEVKSTCHPHLPKQGAQPPAVPAAWSLGGRWPGCRGGPRQAVVSSVS